MICTVWEFWLLKNPPPISLQPFNFWFFYRSQLNKRSFCRLYVRYTLFNSVYICLFISSSFTILLLFILGYEAVQYKQIKLLIISTFSGSWNEIQHTKICFLTEYMLGCAWSRLHGISSFVLDSLNLKLHLQWNLNRGRNETLFM